MRVVDHRNGWLLAEEEPNTQRYVHNPDRMHPDVGYSLIAREHYVLTPVRCVSCGRCWMRCVASYLTPGQLGAWLCPSGWERHRACGGAYFVHVLGDEAAAIEAAWRLTGRYGYGDTAGHYSGMSEQP